MKRDQAEEQDRERLLRKIHKRKLLRADRKRQEEQDQKDAEAKAKIEAARREKQLAEELANPKPKVDENPDKLGSTTVTNVVEETVLPVGYGKDTPAELKKMAATELDDTSDAMMRSKPLTEQRPQGQRRGGRNGQKSNGKNTPAADSAQAAQAAAAAAAAGAAAPVTIGPGGTNIVIGVGSPINGAVPNGIQAVTPQAAA